MIADRAHRSHGPPGTAMSMAEFMRGSACSGPLETPGVIEPARPDPGRGQSLRQLALRRLLNLIEHGGELPLDGSRGVLLPPITNAFLADELGCRPAQAGELLRELIEEGLVVETAGPRYRVPDPRALLRSGFS